MKILVLYSSVHGHLEIMARAIAQSARLAISGNLEVVTQPVSEKIQEELNVLPAQSAKLADRAEFMGYDVILFGTPTRSIDMESQLSSCLDQTDQLWMTCAYIRKVGSVFTLTGTAEGSDTNISSFWNTLARHSVVVVGSPESLPINGVHGRPPRQAESVPSGGDLALARSQGKQLTEIASRLIC